MTGFESELGMLKRLLWTGIFPVQHHHSDLQKTTFFVRHRHRDLGTMTSLVQRGLLAPEQMHWQQLQQHHPLLALEQMD